MPRIILVPIIGDVLNIRPEDRMEEILVFDDILHVNRGENTLECFLPRLLAREDNGKMFY